MGKGKKHRKTGKTQKDTKKQRNTRNTEIKLSNTEKDTEQQKNTERHRARETKRNMVIGEGRESRGWWGEGKIHRKKE